jgi:hypothetical protein
MTVRRLHVGALVIGCAWLASHVGASPRHDRAVGPQQRPDKVTIEPAGRTWMSPDGTYGFSVDAWDPRSWREPVHELSGPEAIDPEAPPTVFEIPTGRTRTRTGTPVRTEQSQRDIDQTFQMIVNTLEKSPHLHTKLKEACQKQGVTSFAIRLVRDDEEVSGGLWRRNSNLAVIDLTDLEGTGARLVSGPNVSAADADGARKVLSRHVVLATVVHEIDHGRDGPDDTWHSDPDDPNQQGLAPLDENHVFEDLQVPIVRPYYWVDLNGRSATPYNVYGIDIYEVDSASQAVSPPTPEFSKYSVGDRSAIERLPGRRCAGGTEGCFPGAGHADPDFDGVRAGDNCPVSMNPDQKMVCPAPARPAWAVPESFEPLRWSDLRGDMFGSTARGTIDRLQAFGTDAPIHRFDAVRHVTGAMRRPTLAVALRIAHRPSPQVRPLQIFVTSMGRSSGPAMQMTVINQTGDPFHLTQGQVALEPVPGLNEQDVARAVEQAGGNGERLVIDAYCLDLAKAVPPAGVVYRLAPAAAQTAMAPVREILGAARYLEWAGALNPDSDPADYFHSIRQWAIWSFRERFDERRFAAAFEEHARRNFAAARRPWTDESARALRAILPGRWRDIQLIWNLAGVRP